MTDVPATSNDASSQVFDSTAKRWLGLASYVIANVTALLFVGVALWCQYKGVPIPSFVEGWVNASLVMIFSTGFNTVFAPLISEKK